MPLDVVIREGEELTDCERAAFVEYGSDATMLHACAQSWSSEFNDLARMVMLLGKAPHLTNHLDSAIQKFELSSDATVFSGHGKGFSVIGWLFGDPKNFVGFKYRYPGYISTSADRGTAENYLRTRADRVSAPVLLQIRLTRGQRIFPMAAVGQTHHAEYVLERSIEFEIKNADLVPIDGVNGDVLLLVLSVV